MDFDLSIDNWQEILHMLEDKRLHISCHLPGEAEDEGLREDREDLTEDEYQAEINCEGVSDTTFWQGSDRIPSKDFDMYSYSSKPMFLTHLLFTLLHLHFSEAQKKAVLSWAKELGAPYVPSLKSITFCGKKIEELIGDPTNKMVASSGNIFYINDVRKAIAKDFANLLLRNAMSDYPHDDVKVSQANQGSKMVNLPHDMLMLTAWIDNKTFFVGELLCTKSGGFFIPDHFFTRNINSEKILFALGRDVARTENQPESFTGWLQGITRNVFA
uniref:Uncharacterized protein n=1 Tax=Moniliophthora roreri TaxID=221103 RepID=A0A0W0EUY2_MONRR